MYKLVFYLFKFIKIYFNIKSWLYNIMKDNETKINNKDSKEIGIGIK